MNKPLKINVIPNTMYDINNFEDLSKPLSDHSLIRVEFKKFIIYSYNILNGSDIGATLKTIKHFIKENLDNKKRLTRKYKAALLDYNIERTGQICDKLLKLSHIEKKPCIFFLQEVSSEMELKVRSKFSGNYEIYTTDNDFVSTNSNVLFKDEKRLSIIPKSIFVENVIKIDVYNIGQAFKTQLLTQVLIDGIQYNICNVHIHFKTLFSQLIDFLNELMPYPNLIIVGDFNTDLSCDELNNFFKNESNLKTLQPDKPTFVDKMGFENSEKSYIIDQVIYNSNHEHPNNELQELTINSTSTPTPLQLGGKLKYNIKYSM